MGFRPRLRYVAPLALALALDLGLDGAGLGLGLGAVEGGAGGSGEEIAVEGEEEGEPQGGVEEEADGEGGGEGLAGVGIGGRGPGEEQARGHGDAARNDEFGEGEEQAVLPARGGEEKGAEDHGVQREQGREEGERFGEFEHWVLRGRRELDPRSPRCFEFIPEGWDWVRIVAGLLMAMRSLWEGRPGKASGPSAEAGLCRAVGPWMGGFVECAGFGVSGIRIPHLIMRTS